MFRYTAILFALLLALFLSLGLSSCGQKGPLKLPPAPQKTTGSTSTS